MTVRMVDLVKLCTASLLLIIMGGCTPSPSEPVAPSASPALPEISESALPSSTDKPDSPAGSPQESPTAPNNPVSSTDPDGNTVIKTDIGSLTLTANPRYLKNVGDTSTIELIAKDSQGKTLDISSLQLTWSSTRPKDFSVDQQGRATAMTDDGYSDITVTETSTGLSAATLISVFNSDLYTSSSKKSSGGGSSSTPTASQTVNAEAIFEGLEYFAVPTPTPEPTPF